MKINITKVIAVMSIFTLIISLFGCAGNKSDKIQSDTKFSQLSQAEKQNFVQAYIKENYNLDCQLTEIKQKQISAIENEENYSTVATINDEFWFSIWITPDEKIIDTAFTYDLKDSVNEYIEKLLLDKGIKCKVIDRFVFEEPSTKVWRKNEIANMFETEKISNIIDLYSVDKDIDDDEIKTALQNFPGAVYIHDEPLNSEKPDFDNYDKFIDLD